ncbi:MAG: hypothetical protein ACPGTO_09270 [Polaribacter sp.]
MNTANTVDGLKSKLINQILKTDNQRLLDVIATIFDVTKNDKDDNIIHLTAIQKEMLEMSEEDIRNGNLISEEELAKKDAEWMQFE